MGYDRGRRRKMRRNLLLMAVLVLSLLLVVNSTKRILTFKTTAQKVGESGEYLEDLKRENEALRRELEYKRSQEFAEAEIRNKLGLVKEGEAVVVLPKQDDERLTTNDESKIEEPNWQKWWNLFFKS